MRDAAFVDFAARDGSRRSASWSWATFRRHGCAGTQGLPRLFGAYSGIGAVRAWLDQLENVFPVGRNGMHRYNNQDHSMLAPKRS